MLIFIQHHILDNKNSYIINPNLYITLKYFLKNSHSSMFNMLMKDLKEKKKKPLVFQCKLYLICYSHQDTSPHNTLGA